MLLFLLSYYDIGDLDVHISSDFYSSVLLLIPTIIFNMYIFCPTSLYSWPDTS